jgi:hypothetical protein
MSSGAIAQCGGLGIEHVHPDQALTQLPCRVGDRLHQLRTEFDDITEALRPVGGADAGQHVPVGLHRAPGGDIGVRDRDFEDIDGDAGNFHDGFSGDSGGSAGIL